MFGKRRVKKIINNFLKEFGVEAKIGKSFCYYPEKELINVSFRVPVDNAGANMFTMNFNHLAPDIKADTFLIALLHELGHHMTVDELTAEEEKESLKKRIELNSVNLKNSTPEEIARANYEYFNMPDEVAATNWAINYIRNNTEKVAEFWNELQPAIMSYYKLNRIGGRQWLRGKLQKQN